MQGVTITTARTAPLPRAVIASHGLKLEDDHHARFAVPFAAPLAAIRLVQTGPDGVLPVIFVPGIMGSNLKSKPEKGKGKNKAAPVWRLDAGFMGKNMWLALNWINKKAGIRQQLLHPARVEVDNKGAVPERSVGTVIVPPETDRKKTILALTKRYE